jgi:uncharacterized protein (DUF433 family)
LEYPRFGGSEQVSINITSPDLNEPSFRETYRNVQTGKLQYNKHGIHSAAREERIIFEQITFDPKIQGGRPCIRGMRIPVSLIIGQFAHGAGEKEILDEYPDLEVEDIRHALEYAAWLTQEQVFVI